MSIKKLLLLVAVFCCSTATAQKLVSVSHGTLVVLEGTTTPLIPLASISNIGKVKQNLKIVIDGPASFLSKKALPTTDKAGTAYLDPLQVGPFNSISDLQLKLNAKTLVTLSVSSTNRELFDFIGQNPTTYENAIVARGVNWYLIKAENVTTASPSSSAVNTMAAAASTTDDRGYSQITYDLEDGGNTIYPHSLCFRFYDPISGKNHRNHYGINVWKITNPITAGFSLKEEFSNSLRCPHRDYKVQEDFIDGIYKKLWGTKAYKVPNHCTSVRYAGYMTCCCNAALSPIYGTCRYEATAPIKWPSRGLTCR